MIIYRVEHPNTGLEPYYNYDYFTGPLAEHAWFRLRDWRWMWNHGMVVSLYNVPAEYVRSGKRQVIFHKAKATKISVDKYEKVW